MIIQNRSLGVPGRAALVDGTNWRCRAALLAVKDQALRYGRRTFYGAFQISSFVGKAATAAQRRRRSCSVHK